MNMALTKRAARQIIAIVTPGMGAGGAVFPWIKLTIFTSIVN